MASQTRTTESATTQSQCVGYKTIFWNIAFIVTRFMTKSVRQYSFISYNAILNVLLRKKNVHRLIVIPPNVSVACSAVAWNITFVGYFRRITFRGFCIKTSQRKQQRLPNYSKQTSSPFLCRNTTKATRYPFFLLFSLFAFAAKSEDCLDPSES